MWLKRDLRTRDHEPIFQAEQSGKRMLLLYVLDYSIIGYQDTSRRHLRFIGQSLKVMNATLKKKEHQVYVLQGNTGAIFRWLFDKYSVEKVFMRKPLASGLKFSRMSIEQSFKIWI